jgi:hypothetical protein
MFDTSQEMDQSHPHCELVSALDLDLDLDAH